MKELKKTIRNNMEMQDASRTIKARTTTTLIKPITFGNPNSSGQARFFTEDGHEKPFIQGITDSEEPYTIVGEHGRLKPVYIPSTYDDGVNRAKESSKDVEAAAAPRIGEGKETITAQKTDVQKSVTFAELVGLDTAPNLTLGASVEDQKPVIQNNMQTPGTYNLPWQQGWMGATNQINDIPAAGGQDIVAQNKTESEPQSQIGAGQNYTDQVLRMQQLQQPSTVINGIASTDNTTEVSVVNQPKQVPGKQTYTKAEVQFTSDGCLQITVSYSGFQKCAVIKQLWGGYQIFKLEYESDPSKARRFQVVFGSGVIVLGRQKGLTEETLYKYFVGAGVDLKAGGLKDLPVKAVKEALYVFFKQQIESASKIAVDGKGGWLNRTWKWLCSENNPYTDREVVPNLPIMNKKFWTKDIKQIDSNWLKVFDLYKEIPNESYRILFMEILVGGVLSSKFNEAGASMKCFLNLVLMEGMQIEPFCKMFQVFNRDQFECYELSGREKPEKYLMSTKDQVMVLHSTSVDSKYKYKVQQRDDRLNQIVDAVCYGAGHGSVVVINSERTDREEGINIFLDSSFITERMSELLKQDVVGDFLQKFILWVMNRGYGQPKVENILHTVTCNSSVLDKVCQILEVFCESQGLDLYERLGITKEVAKEVNADPFCMEDELSVSDIIATIRNQIGAFHVEDRNRGKYADDARYQNKETTWIPVAIMDHIFEQGGIRDKAGALKLLKQEKILIAKNKLTTRITVDDHPMECYRLKSSALNSRGKVELALLGKETK